MTSPGAQREPLVVTADIEIAAAPARVWRVLTEPEFTARYMFGCVPVTDWRVGSIVEWRGPVRSKSTSLVLATGTVLACDPGRRLRYTVFPLGMGLADVPSNHVPVTVVLTPTAGGTRVEVTQGDFGPGERAQERFEGTRAAWPTTLAGLRQVAEQDGRRR